MSDVPPVQGKLIVLEGLDGSGTTTQADLLARHLRGRELSVEREAEPTTGALGAVVRHALEGRLHLSPTALALAFAADRADHADSARGLDAALGQGTWVVCDRYVLSSVAYQSAQGLDVDWIKAINRFARPPDVTIFVDTPLEECLRRSTARSRHTDLFENRDMLTRIERAYREALQDRSLTGDVVIVDGANDVSGVADDVVRGLTGIGLLEPIGP